MTEGNSNDIVLFCFVAGTRSFSRAARELGVSRSLVSKRIAKLERRLQTRLIRRSTRSLSLTEAGELLYRRYSDIRKRIDHAEREVADLDRDHSGVIRLAAPAAWSYAGVPHIAELHRRFPDLEVQLSAVDGELNLIHSGHDAALHIGELEDSALVCRRIASVPLAVCAAPSYLAEHGAPERPSDLVRHKCLCANAAGTRRWRFREAGGESYTAPVNVEFSTDSELLLLRACVAGMGMTQLPRLLVDEHLEAGQLKLVLEDFSYQTDDIYVLLPQRDVPDKVRLVIDYLVGHITERYADRALS